MLSKQVHELVGGLREVVASLDPACIEGRDATRLLAMFAEGERVCAAAKTLLAGRVDDANAWQRNGHKSAAHWLAAATGDTLGNAIGVLDTARSLDALPATETMLRAGELSAAQARVIAKAAAADPQAEERLLARAKVDSVAGLRDECRKVIAAACRDETARDRQIFQERYVRHWIDADGAGCGQWRLPLDQHARVVAAVENQQKRVFDDARKANRHEAAQAYAADALVELCTCAPGDSTVEGLTRPQATVHVLIGIEPLTRGWSEPGETCEIAGVGPISVATARKYLGDAFLKLLVKDGVDITTVAHCKRTVPERLRTYLKARDKICVVPGCGVHRNLEVDHTFINFADGGLLSAANTALLCPWHHHLKTYCGYRLAGGPGHWQWIPPGISHDDGDPDDRGPPGAGPPGQQQLDDLKAALDAVLTNRRAALAGP